MGRSPNRRKPGEFSVGGQHRFRDEALAAQAREDVSIDPSRRAIRIVAQFLGNHIGVRSGKQRGFHVLRGCLAIVVVQVAARQVSLEVRAVLGLVETERALLISRGAKALPAPVARLRRQPLGGQRARAMASAVSR